MTQPRPRIALIIVTHNSAQYFARQRAAIDALLRQPDELFIVDSGSAPEQTPKPEDWPPGARLHIAGANIGFAAANNWAVGQSSCTLVCLLNPDAFPEPTWLGALEEAARQYPLTAAFGSTQVSASMPGRLDGLGDCYHVAGLPWRGGFGAAQATTPILSGEVFSPCAAAALYRRDAWLAVGGFDESFFCYCEDVDLGFRLRLAGHSVRQVGDAVVHHVGGASSGRRSDFAVFHGTRNRLWVFVKCMPGWAFWMFAPAHITMTLAILVWSALRGTGRPTRRGVAAALDGWSTIWKARTQTQRLRRAPPSALLKMMAASPLTALRRRPVIK